MDRLTQTFLDLVRIPSPSLKERAVADWILARARALQFEAFEDGAGAALGGHAGNLFVRVPASGTGPRLFLSAHMDTVESGERAIVPVERNGEFYSDGSSILGADDKTGCAVLLELLASLKENPTPHGELLISFSVAEEIELLGVGAMDPALHAGFDAGIVLDHSLPNQIILGAPTKLALKITVHGHGGHGAFPERRINAAHALATALSRLPSDRLDEYTTCNLGILRSGDRINVIPESAYAEYELRSHRADLVDFHLHRTLATIETAVREHRKFILGEEHGLGGDGAEHPSPIRKATVDVDVRTCYECYRHAPDALPVRLLSEAIEASGETVSTVIAQGGSDANVLNARGLPTAVIGCGMHGAHSTRERATPAEMRHCVTVLRHALTER